MISLVMIGINMCKHCFTISVVAGLSEHDFAVLYPIFALSFYIVDVVVVVVVVIVVVNFLLKCYLL